MNVFAKIDEIPSMTLQDIKETKHHGHTFGRSFGRTDVKTVYPPTNTVCGGYNNLLHDTEKKPYSSYKSVSWKFSLGYKYFKFQIYKQLLARVCSNRQNYEMLRLNKFSYVLSCCALVIYLI